jgi:hypothetical protein
MLLSSPYIPLVFDGPSLYTVLTVKLIISFIARHILLLVDIPQRVRSKTGPYGATRQQSRHHETRRHYRCCSGGAVLAISLLFCWAETLMHREEDAIYDR